MRALVLPIRLGVLAAACAMLWPAWDALFQEPGAAGSLGAWAAVFLASDESDYVTGTSLYVDGGMTLYPEFASGG